MAGLQASNIFLEPIEQNTVTEMVAKSLIKLISDGTLKPGDKLPPERELAQRLNVGRTTVREALKLLTLGGLLEAKRGAGTYVRQEFNSLLSQQIEWPLLLNNNETEMIFEVREALEAKTARLAAGRATPDEIERMTVYPQLLEIKGRDIERETDLDLVFHQAVADASHNKLFSGLMSSMQNILHRYIALSIEMTDDLGTIVAEHAAVCKAIIARDPDAAEQRI